MIVHLANPARDLAPNATNRVVIISSICRLYDPDTKM